MTHPLFDKHQALIAQATQTLASRGYWSPFHEMPTAKAYGETAAAEGKQAFDGHVGSTFVLGQPGQTGLHGGERSPFGARLDVSYPVCDPEVLIAAALEAMPEWERLGAEGRIGILVESLHRLNKRSFELGHAVMMTTGQAWMMAFQAGGPHAQDRGLEAVACAWREQSAIPSETIWEKPQGKNPPVRMKKNFRIVGRGVALVIGCGTFPTWNTYPGMFAALATGNPVIVKPHSNAILPAAITVSVIREVLFENGINPNVITLAVAPERIATQILATHRDVKSVDFTGSSQFGHWLLENCKQAQVYAELAGVNNVVIESTDQYRSMLKNLAFTLSLYSGQMCTTTQAIIVPATGIDTDEGHKGYEEVAADLGVAIKEFVADPKIAHAVLGAIQSKETLRRIDESPAWAEVVLPSQRLEHPEFPLAVVRTPTLLKCGAADEHAYMEERFGPISFVVKTKDAVSAVELAERITRDQGALTCGVYSTKPEVLEAMIDAASRTKVALSINLTGNILVNQSAAFSDFHGTGGNPAANASYSDSAFVANRFRVAQRRVHV